MKTKKKISGIFWHCHYDILCEYVWDYQERVNYIKENKPKNEIETRLRLFKKVKGKLPEECIEAYEKWEEAYNKRGEAYKNWGEAYEKWEEAYEKWEEAYKKYKPKLEALHKKECGCKEWNGEGLVFEK